MKNLPKREKAIIDKIQMAFPQARSVLDIGCSEGNILIYCKDALGFKTAGIDQNQAALDSLQKMGIDARFADARKLPFADQEFDVVILSNVLHHIPNPAVAMSEALRVAKMGVIASESWHDVTINCQKLGQEIDNWCKKLHQALGYFHRHYLNAGEIIGLIDSKNIMNLEVDYYTNLEPCDSDYWLSSQQEYLSRLQENHVMLWELKNLKEKVKNKLLCKPGWLIVTVSL